VKTKTLYSCQKCGYQSPKWLGKCPDCNSWNTLVEETLLRGDSGPKQGRLPSRSPSPGKRRCGGPFSCGIPEFDRVLGGGVVAGSLVSSEEIRASANPRSCSRQWTI